MFHGVLDRPKKDQAAINSACLLTFTRICMYVCMYRVCMYAYHPYHTIYALTFAGLNFCRVKLLQIADFSNFCVFISVDAGS